MTEFRRGLSAGVLLFAVAGCQGQSEQEPSDVAGGQSGTDAAGQATCILDPDSTFEVDFQDVIDEFGVTPQRLSNLARGSRILVPDECERDDVLHLEVRALYTTHVVPGHLSTEEGPYCEAIDIDVEAHAWSDDGTVDATGSRLRFFPMRLRPLGDLVLEGASIVQLHFDLQDFSQKTQRGDEYVVKADVYESGELDELGQVVPDDPATGRSYLDTGPSCE